jgi:NitT/TauT family transport system substrate-binding protein
LIKKDNPDMTDDVLAQAIDKMKSYGIVFSEGMTPAGVGTMTAARWKAFFEAMSAEGIYSPSLDYTKAYDLSFVKDETPKPIE